MNDQDVAFNAALHGVEVLINQRERHWADALAAALELTRQYPDRIEAWHQLYLVRQLRNELDEAVQALAYARHCPGFTTFVAGDFLRDQLFGMIRRRETLDIIERAIEDLRVMHAGDSTRLACIDGLAGRLAYAKGRYLEATKLHARASRQLEDTNDQWHANNLLHWLKALTMAHRRPGMTARWIRRDIAYYADSAQWNGEPLLTRRHEQRAELIGYFGKLGCWIDDRVAKRS